MFSSAVAGGRKHFLGVFSQPLTALAHSDLSEEDYAVWVYTGGSSPLLPAMHAILGLRKLLGTFSVKTFARFFPDWIGDWKAPLFFSVALKTIPIRLNNLLTGLSESRRKPGTTSGSHV